MLCFRLLTNFEILVFLFLFGFDFSHLGHDSTLSHFIFINRDCFILIGFIEEEVNILCIITQLHMHIICL